MASPESGQKGQDSEEVQITGERCLRERKATDHPQSSSNHGNDLEDSCNQPEPNDGERSTKTSGAGKSVGTRGRKRNKDKRGEYMLGPNTKPEDVKHRSVRRRHTQIVMWEMIWEREDNIKELLEKDRNKRDETSKLKKENQDKARQVKDKTDAKITQLKEMANSIELENKDLKSKVQELNETLRKQKIEIQDMCNERVELLNKGDISVQPDDVVAGEIRKLFRRSRELAAKWAISNWSNTAKEGTDKIANSLRQGSVSEFASDRLLTALHEGTVPPKVIVTALFNRALCQETFLRPLDILNFGDPQVSSQQLMDRLSRVSQLLSKQSTALASRFRTLCIHSLKGPENATSGDGFSENKLHVHNLRDGCVHRIVDRILNDCWSTLFVIPNESTERTCIKDLEMMATEFVTLHIDINSQYPHMEMRFRDSLLNQGFTAFHEQFQGHRALKLKDDKDDEEGETAEEAGIEGQKLDLVIEPCVVRVGDADGTLYDQERILVRGIVWMVRPDKIKAEPGLGDTFDAGSKAAVPRNHFVFALPNPSAFAKDDISARPTNLRQVLDSVEVPQRSTTATSYLPLRLRIKPPIQHQVHVAEDAAEAEEAEERSSTTTTSIPYSYLDLPSPAKQDSARPVDKTTQKESTHAKRPLAHHELDDKPIKKQKKWHAEAATAAKPSVLNTKAMPDEWSTDEEEI